jgi:hypothetical protein
MVGANYHGIVKTDATGGSLREVEVVEDDKSGAPIE